MQYCVYLFSEQVFVLTAHAAGHCFRHRDLVVNKTDKSLLSWSLYPGGEIQTMRETTKGDGLGSWFFKNEQDKINMVENVAENYGKSSFRLVVREDLFEVGSSELRPDWQERAGRIDTGGKITAGRGIIDAGAQKLEWASCIQGAQAGGSMWLAHSGGPIVQSLHYI